MRKRSVGIGAVGWLKRAVKTVGALMVMSVCLAAAAHAETRTLQLYNTHTKERVSITFKKNGRYIPAGLREANRFLRDWRRNEIIKMDPELLDLVWEVYQKVGATKPIYVVSSYRSPATNNMLRKRSSGVAKHSQHMLGKAMDYYIPGVNLAKLRVTGLRKQVGGVGYYPRSGSPFVHMDTGRVRHWPRMTRSQLAKVFPDGKTLHIPSDGKPLKGYKVALAETNSGKSRSSRPTIVASSSPPSTRNQNLRNAGDPIRPTAQEPRKKTSGNFLASLFGGGNNNGQSGRAGAVGNQRTADAKPDFTPVIENPPIPTRKVLDSKPEPVEPDTEAVAITSAAPVFKPRIDATPALVASAEPNTLDSQRIALESGQPLPASQPIDSRFLVARAPSQKPGRNLSEAAQAAAANLGLTGSIPVPASSPVDDPVAAIAAATGTSTPSPAPAPRPETTLAYASATATPPTLNRSLRPTIGEQRNSGDRAGTQVSNRSGNAQPSLSGRIPRDQIVDPLAGFASLPDKSEPKFLSGAGTVRQQNFAWLSHPNQRALNNVMKPSNRFVSASFERSPYRGLRSDRFDGGPAVVFVPVRFAR